MLISEFQTDRAAISPELRASEHRSRYRGDDRLAEIRRQRRLCRIDLPVELLPRTRDVVPEQKIIADKHPESAAEIPSRFDHELRDCVEFDDGTPADIGRLG